MVAKPDEFQDMVSCYGHLGRLDGLEETSPLFDSGGVWRVDETSNGIRLILRRGEHPGRPYHVLDLDNSLTSGHVLVDPTGLEDGPQFFALRDPVHELWISFLLMRGRGILVHGCGLMHGERVHVFPGQSGAGKSTLARLFKSAGKGPILSDDRLIIRPSGEGFTVFGTPWHGEAPFSSPCSGPLASVNFIEKAPSSALHEMSPDRVGASLFAACFLAGWPRSGLQFVLDSCASIAANVPGYRLLFTPDRTAIEAVLS